MTATSHGTLVSQCCVISLSHVTSQSCASWCHTTLSYDIMISCDTVMSCITMLHGVITSQCHSTLMSQCCMILLSHMTSQLRNVVVSRDIVLWHYDRVTLMLCITTLRIVMASHDVTLLCDSSVVEFSWWNPICVKTPCADLAFKSYSTDGASVPVHSLAVSGDERLKLPQSLLHANLWTGKEKQCFNSLFLNF